MIRATWQAPLRSSSTRRQQSNRQHTKEHDTDTALDLNCPMQAGSKGPDAALRAMLVSAFCANAGNAVTTTITVAAQVNSIIFPF